MACKTGIFGVTSPPFWMPGLMLLAGMGIPIMAALNGALGSRIGSPAAAAILFSVGLVCALLAVAATGGIETAKVFTAPPLLFLGGAFVAFYVLSITMLGPRMGIAPAILFVLIGQLISAAAVEHMGLFGAPKNPFSIERGIGFALMATGVWLAKR